MENLICVDTDIIIDHLIGKGTGVKTFERIIKKEIPFTTHINRFELLCGARNDKEVEIINECLLGFTILPFDEPSSQEATFLFIKNLTNPGRQRCLSSLMIQRT